MKKITKLTERQESRLQHYIDKWTDIGLCTDPANREQAEKAINLCYESACLKVPDKIIWCGSPLSMAIAHTILKDDRPKQKIGKSIRDSVRDSVEGSVEDSVGVGVWASVGTSVWDSVWASVRASVWTSVEGSVGESVWESVRGSVWASVGTSVEDSVGKSVGESVWESVWASVRASVWYSVGDSVGESVWDSVKDSIGDSIGDSVKDSVKHSIGDSVKDSVRDGVGESIRDSVEDSVEESVGYSVGDSVGDSVWASVWDSVRTSAWASVGTSVRDSFYGQHDANWLAFYEFFNKECGLKKQTERLKGLWLGAQSHGWWLPCKNICFVAERHNLLKRDDRGLLHCEDGPALTFPDGFAIHSWHGIRVPEEWITQKDKLTAKTALTWKNVEQRRAACEILGWETILNELDAKTVDKDEDPLVGELVEVTIPDIGKEKFLRVVCGTGRKFALPVPPEMQTALEANSWTWGLEGFEYKPEIRT